MKLKSWDETAEWIDQQFTSYPPSYMSEAITVKYYHAHFQSQL